MSSKDHYNRVAVSPPKQCMHLRHAHRNAKRWLIHTAAQLARGDIMNTRVIDFACGRGGDMVKCQGCASYLGVDTAEEALRELHRRADEIGMTATTVCMDAADIPVSECELALCNFALHYFCDTKQHVQRLLAKVSACLQPGGAFVGTYQRWPDEHTIAFGQAHHAVVGDCVNAVEWRVPFADITCTALRCGLALVYHQPLTMIDENADNSVWAFIMRQSSQHYDKQVKE